MLNFRQIILSLLFFSITISAQSIPITVSSNIDSSIATIGDRIHLNIIMQYPEGNYFELPHLDKKLGKWDIIDQELSESRKIKHGYRQLWTLELTVFDTGKVIIPSLELRALSAADSTQALLFQTDEYTVDVISVLPPGTTEPKDIKPPFAIRKLVPWTYIIFFLLVAAIIIAWWIYYRRWKQKTPPLPLNENYLEAPHLTAFRKLNELREHQYRSEDEIRQYYFSLSEIVREYLERRYFVRALEMTTREILESFPELDINGEIELDFKSLFDGLDLIKFAKFIPEPGEMIEYWDSAYNCIDKTKHEPFLK